MVQRKKTLIVCLIVLASLIGPISGLRAGEKEMILDFQGQTFSASLKAIPLRLILEELEREKGIWFKGIPSLLDEEITVQFAALSLENGIKRILASKNYSLVFDRDGEPTGVVIIGRVASDMTTSEVRTDRARRSIASRPPKKRVIDVGGLEVTRDSRPSGGPEVFTDEDPESVKVVTDAPGPGGSVKVTAEEVTNFTVTRNCPPPGGPVEVTEQEVENFKIVRDSPPPGGPVEVTAEELQGFKIIKDCPPPGN